MWEVLGIGWLGVEITPTRPPPGGRSGVGLGRMRGVEKAVARGMALRSSPKAGWWVWEVHETSGLGVWEKTPTRLPPGGGGEGLGDGEDFEVVAGGGGDVALLFAKERLGNWGGVGDGAGFGIGFVFADDTIGLGAAIVAGEGDGASEGDGVAIGCRWNKLGGAEALGEIAKIAQGHGGLAAALVDIFDGIGNGERGPGLDHLRFERCKASGGDEIEPGGNGAIGQNRFGSSFCTVFLGEGDAQEEAPLDLRGVMIHAFARWTAKANAAKTAMCPS